MALLVVLAMVAAVPLLREAADSHRRAQVLAEQIRATSQEMSALRWEANTQLLSGNADFSTSGVLVGAGAKILSTLDAEATEFARIQPGRDARLLRRDVDQLLAGALRGLGQARNTGPQAKAYLAQMQTQFQPILDQMDNDAGRVARDQEVVAARVLNVVQWASIGSVLLGIGALAALVWRLAALRRRTVIAAEVREAERRSEHRVRALVEQSSDVVTLLDRDLRVRWQAASIMGLLGLEPGSLIEQPIASIAHPDEQALLEGFLRAQLDGSAPATHRTRLAHSDGRWIHVEIVAADQFANPAIGALVLTTRDVSERLAFEDELRHQAFHDALTGLANRGLFENRLRHALAAGVRTQRAQAVLFLDLDDFKTINDSLGHGVGDLLLQRLAARIDPLVRPTDTTARLGGDEFAVLLDGVDGTEAREIAERMLAALSEGFRIDNRELRVTVSIGIALSDGSIDADELLRNADMAMYAAKASGKSCVHAFEEKMHQSALRRLELRTELPHALENDELFLEYQPIVSLDEGRIVGAEALVRWQHPRRGRIPPDQFISLAEESGLIVPLGRWVLEHACAEAGQWRTVLGERTPYLSVNVSIRQLYDEGFPLFVAEVLASAGVEPEALVLEITEGLLATDRNAIVTRLTAFKRLGVRIAVDDFGTGYSALSHLQHFPIDILKIDKSFIDELHTGGQKASLVQGIINLGESLELDVIAEGIEQPEQAAQLKAMRSPLGQGFLFSRPVSPAEILEFARRPGAERDAA